MEFQDRRSALVFLRTFRRDSLSMMNIRKILARNSLSRGLYRLNDHQVLEQIAWLLVSGKIKFLELTLDIPGWGDMEPAVEEVEEVKPVPVVPRSLTNAKWSQNFARVEEVVKLSADVEGYETGTKAVFEIFEMDIGGKDDFITKINSSVQGNKVKSEWAYKYIEDTDDVSEEDEKKGYSSPEYYFWVKVKNSKARSDLLEFRDWIEIELIDENDNPVANEDYVLYLPNGEVRKGKLDANGYKKEENIPPGKCQVEFPNQSNVEV